MANIFLVVWVICFNKSMSIWQKKCTCPGWIFCPCKQHPLGNEYHTAFCSLCNILFLIKMVKGKDAPPQVDVPFSPYGKIVGFLLQMLKSYFYTENYVVLDSSFCVLKGIIKLWEMGLFACTLIKKRQSQPLGVPRDAMQVRFDWPGVNVGDVDAILRTQDGTPYFL
jgi:hypothetical protein